MIEFTCKGCGTPTALLEVDAPPPSGLCSMCAFFGVDWEDDPHLVQMVDAIQQKHRAH